MNFLSNGEISPERIMVIRQISEQICAIQFHRLIFFLVLKEASGAWNNLKTKKIRKPTFRASLQTEVCSSELVNASTEVLIFQILTWKRSVDAWRGCWAPALRGRTVAFPRHSRLWFT